MYSRVFRLIALSFTTMALALAGQATPALAAPAGNAAADSVFTITDRLAQQLAGADARALFSAAASGPVNLSRATDPVLHKAVEQANHAVLAAKGLPASDTALLRLRLADPDMLAAVNRGAAPLVAAAPTDDVSSAVIAYDTRGGQVILDAVQVPKRPVFVVEVDTAAALPMG